MSTDSQKAKSIFLAAVEQYGPERWGTYLDEACGEDAELRRRVEELLAAHQGEDSLLDEGRVQWHAALATVPYQPVAEKPGTVIGPYKLLEQIGEGGFGVVFMAEQQQPVRRKVALKIIKPGMDTKEVIARFEAERQALALMDHANIARVLDAGATESGRPYFVMELVRGVPITEYCDQANLTAKERLGLFISVCQAVQHAHQKGIIHRDIKPSNVMVTLRDDTPVAKVIDFGVAKATNQRLTDKTVFTRFAQMVGTPLYMSPEQAGMSELDVDTRSDIYSLGVLLYELLTGTTPFDQRRLREAAYDELLRIIREEEPPKPSTRVSSLGDTVTDICAHRRTDPRHLSQFLRGDLDWIVMKALEKDRKRRYETANGLAEDVGHYLADEPVHACPPSAAYRFRKFARRNKVPMAITTVALLVLIVVAIGAMIAASRFRNLAQHNADLARRNNDLVDEKDAALTTAIQAQKEAEEARDRERGLRKEEQRQRKLAQANFALARSAVDEFLNHVTENELMTVPGLQPLRHELLSSALEFYDSFTRDDANTDELLVEMARAHYRIAVIRGELGQQEGSTAANEKSLSLFEQLRDSGNESLMVRLGLAKSYFRAGRCDETIMLCQAIRENDPDHAETRSLLANTYNALAVADCNDGHIASSLAYQQEALTLRQGLVDDFPDNPVYLGGLGNTLNNLGVLHARQGNGRRALELFKLSVSFCQDAYRRSPQTIRRGRSLCIVLRNVAVQQPSFGEHVEALENYRRVVEIRRRLAFDNPRVPSLRGELYRSFMDLGKCQRELDRFEEANRSFEEAKGILEILRHETDSPAELFELAIVYAALATPPEGAADPPDEEDVLEQQHYADLAMEKLRQAVKHGYRDVDALRSHEYLTVLRERDDFAQLVDHLDKLRQAEELVSSEIDADAEKPGDRRQVADALRGLIRNDGGEFRHRKTLADLVHSVGVIQTRLRQFDEAEQSLQEALQLREELCEQHPQDPGLWLELLSTCIALGDRDWAGGQFAAAHTRWQQCLSESAEFLAAHPDSSVVRESRLAAEEQTIYRRYCTLALWPLLREFADRTARYERDYQFGIGDYLLIQGVLAANDREATECLLRRLATVLHDVDLVYLSTKYAYCALIRTAAIADVQIIPWDQMVSIAQRVVDERGATWGRVVALAVAQYRAGKCAEALQTIRPFREQHLAFLEAAITERLGDHEGAVKLWTEAQSRYQADCSGLLQSAPPEGPKLYLPGWKGAWSRFANIQALRREAYRVIYGGEAADPWQHLIQARGYRLIGETQQSEAELAAAAAAADNDPQIWLARARLFEQWKELERANADWRKASADLARAVERKPHDPKLWETSAEVHESLKQWDEAISDLTQAIKFAPDDERPVLKRAHLCMKVKQWDQAIDDFSHALDLKPDDLQLLKDRAMAYRDCNQREKEIEDRTRLIELDANHPWHWYYRGQAFLALRQLDRAEADFDQAIRLDSNRERFLPTRGNCYAQQGKWRQAADDFAKAVENATPNQNAGFWCWRNHALLRLMVDDPEGYRVACAELLERFGSTTDAVQARALVRACTLFPDAVSADQYDRLMVLAKRADWSGPMQTAVHFRAGRYERAIELFQTGSGEEPGGLGYICAMVNYHLDNYAEAVRLLRGNNKWMDEQRAQAPDPMVPVASWSDWACRVILRREAEQLIEDTESKRQDDREAMPTEN